MSQSGKLCVSVIEARNVAADEYADRHFYVKLKIGQNEIRTDIVKGSLQPKFLKDCRLLVLAPDSDVLRIELLQVGPRGDLIVGSDELRILSIVNRGTIVHWFELRTATRAVGAELCLVLRYLSAGSNRPMSPSYAIAARQAKEQALGPQQQGHSTVSKALFVDPPQVVQAIQTPNPGAYQQQQYVQAPQTPQQAYAPAAPHTLAQGYPMQGSAMQTPVYPSPVQAPQQQQRSQQHDRHLSAAGPAQGTSSKQHSRTGLGRVLSVLNPLKHLPGVFSRLPSGIRPVASVVAKQLTTASVPLPIALLCGAAAGAVVYVWKQRPVYYEVQEDDTLCHIATCHERTPADLYDRHRDLLRTSAVVPGDRIRIR